MTDLFGRENINRDVLEPFKKLKKFLLEEYIPNTRHGMAHYIFSVHTFALKNRMNPFVFSSNTIEYNV